MAKRQRKRRWLSWLGNGLQLAHFIEDETGCIIGGVLLVILLLIGVGLVLFFTGLLV
ncbi:MAG: hypothetical protein AAGI46_01765 [Planctomycetota bacterium]